MQNDIIFVCKQLRCVADKLCDESWRSLCGAIVFMNFKSIKCLCANQNHMRRTKHTHTHTVSLKK